MFVEYVLELFSSMLLVFQSGFGVHDVLDFSILNIAKNLDFYEI